MHPAAYVLAGYLAMEGDLEGAAEEFDRFSSLTGTNPAVFRNYLAALCRFLQSDRRGGVFPGRGVLWAGPGG